MSLWDFENKETMLSHLVGKEFGEDPVKKMNEIRQTKIQIAQMIYSHLNLKENATVVEIGSGLGIMANWMASKVAHVHCCDVSASFLEVAKEECKNQKNTSFHLLKKNNLEFAANESIDAVYSYNVFIHLNLYDIFMYFRDFKRALKVGGKVWFDIANADLFSSEVPKLFHEMAGLYEKSPQNVALLVHYISPSGIIGIAQYFGFNTKTPVQKIGQSMLIFTKEE